jgi:AcrR family transcriptional regulator
VAPVIDATPPSSNGSQQETRELLLRAASEEFLEHGFEGARVQEIALRAGFTTGAIYANFSGKTGLMVETLNREGRRFIDVVFQALQETGEQGGHLLSELGVEMMAGTPQVAHRMFIEAIAVALRDEAVYEELMPHLGLLGEGLLAVVTSASENDTLDPAVSPEAVAHFCVILALGSFTLKALGSDPLPEDDARQLMLSLLRGLSNPTLPG